MHSLKLFVIVLSSVILFYAGNLSAQSSRWEFVVEGGMGLRSLRIDPSYPSLVPNDGLSYSAGIAGIYNFDYVWAVKLGAAYERKGTDFDRTDISTTGSVNLDYISVPLLARAKFGKRFKFFVNTGPYLGILLSNQTIINAYSNVSEQVFDNTDSTKSTDFGISLGAGVEFPDCTCGIFTIEIRDNFGLTNISKSKETNAPELKTNSLNLLIGYAFKFR